MRSSSYLALFAACLFYHAAGTWLLPLVDRDEPRFAEASREMRERHDYVVPFFNNRCRFDKPPFIYWLQTASYTAFGDNDFAARLPSAVAAGLIAVVLLAWGRRAGEDRLGWSAAIIFTLCLQVFLHSKAAVADMWLVFFVTLAHWALFELLGDSLVQRKPPLSGPQLTLWRTIFYVALGLGFLAKGPLAWMPLVTAIATKFWLRLSLNQRLHLGRGLLLTLAIVAAWGVPALVQTNGEYFKVGIGRHVVERSLVPSEGHGLRSVPGYLLLLPFYFATVFVSFFPWSIKLPAAVRSFWQRRDHFDRFCIAAVMPLFILLSFVSTKLPHYTLPSYPVLALAFARRLPVIAAPRFMRRTAVASCAAGLITAFAVFPWLARLFPTTQLLAQAQPYLTATTDIAAYEYAEPSIVWYFRGYTHRFFQGLFPEKISEYINTPGPRLVIMRTQLAKERLPIIPPDCKQFSVRGFDLVKGKWTDLTLVIRPSEVE